MYNFTTTLKKSILGFVTGLAAVVILAIAQAITNYQPTTETPTWLQTIYLSIIPMVTSALVGLANYLKNKDKGNVNPS